jgi:hypothetical protein
MLLCVTAPSFLLLFLFRGESASHFLADPFS